MYNLGIDMGTSTIKMVLTKDGTVVDKKIKKHQGRLMTTAAAMLEEIADGTVDLAVMSDSDKSVTGFKARVTVTGGNSEVCMQACPQLNLLDDIPAVVDGVKSLVQQAGSIIEIGSQGARFITDVTGVPRFSVNEHCAGGTGSFFEDQMTRLGLKIEDYSAEVAKAREIPTLSGRCAVFAKTDIIHRQQEGVAKQDILLGLCYAMIRNFKAVIVKNLPVKKPVVFCGGVTENTGVIRAICDIFKLGEDELIIPENARYDAAVGAALNKDGFEIDLLELSKLFAAAKSADDFSSGLEPLYLTEGTKLTDPQATHAMPDDGCYIGIDIGSTSTDLVLVAQDGTLIDFWYLRTAGEPENVVRKALKNVRENYGEFNVLGVGITGSGRERLGKMMGADAIRDEITAQAKAAVYYVPDADTVFEIGGQDSKYISLKDGEVADFTMNKICAAGTGSFVEEQSLRMGIPIGEFGNLALQGKNPCDLGERCTVFIETSIASAEGAGVSREDIAAGLCHSIVKNYLHKVVANKPVGKSIVLQGGVDYNPGIVAAFMSAYRDRITVSPVFSISGAIGAAHLAKDAMLNADGTRRKSTFLGVDFPKEEKENAVSSEEIRANRAFYRKAGQFLLEDYDNVCDPSKKTVGVPLSLIMYKFFPLANEFFKNLGFNVLLSDSTNEHTIEAAQASAKGETCYPIKLLYGHMLDLADKGVDYIFMPTIRTIRHVDSKAVHNYACPYMQTAARSIFKTLELEKRGIKLISPVFDFDLGTKSMAVAMLEAGKQLGFAKPRCMVGMLKGAAAVKRFSANVERVGEEFLSNLKPDEKVIVLITRTYNISDPVLNMGIPEILLNKGYKVMTLGNIPGTDIDIADDYPNMYWPFGDHILSGAKIIAHHPNLYPVYITNHGCGPDSLISHMFREEMGDKPYLQIEVDEHFSKVGVITRIEAFLNSISHRLPVEKAADFNMLNVRRHKADIVYKPSKSRKLLLPDAGYYTDCLKVYFDSFGYTAEKSPEFDKEVLNIGRAYMNSKEYLPLPMLLGSILKADTNAGGVDYLVPFNYGSDADGQYARAIRTILDKTGHTGVGIVAPVFEELMNKADDTDMLFRAVLLGDIVYTVPYVRREEFAKKYINAESIKSIENLESVADLAYDECRKHEEQNYIIGNEESPDRQKVLAVVGSPLSVTSLDEGITDKLELRGYRIARMPFAEMMLFMWVDNKMGTVSDKNRLGIMIKRISDELGTYGTFALDIDELLETAKANLDGFQGNNGRYRFAKTVQMGGFADAVIEMSPRYENTAMVLDMRNLSDKTKAPLYNLSLDGDWDEASENRLNSFLYYCR